MEPDLFARVERSLSPERRALLATIIATAEQPLYIIGGVVRDALRDLPIFDLDLVVEGDAIELAQKLGALSAELPATNRLQVLVHRQFGTAKLSLPDGQAIDLVSARSEQYASPSALPAVQPGTLRDDIMRRDFTINALALAIPSGTLIDLVHGVDDLQKGLIRTLYPQSFLDDATRMLRAVRYEQRYNFKIEPGTLKQLHFFRNQIKRLSGDRVRHELQRDLEEHEPEKVLLRMAKLKLLQTIEPALQADQWLAERYRLARAAISIQAIPLPLLYWGLLVYRNTAEELERIVERLRLDAKLAALLREAIALRPVAAILQQPGITRSTIYHLLAGSSQVARAVLALAEPESASQIALFEGELAAVAPHTGGKQLRARGVPAGPVYKQIIEALRDAWLDRRITSEEEEMSLLEQLLSAESRL